jgi:hypothetical protein
MTTNSPKILPANMPRIVDADKTQVSVFTSAMYGVFDTFATEARKTQAAKDDATKAQDAEHGVRETLLLKLATFSAAQALTVDFVKENLNPKTLTDAWAKDRKINHKLTTLTQFCVECRRAMHPQARDHVADAITESLRAWKAEDASVEAQRADNAKAQEIAAKKSETFKPTPIEQPLHAKFARRYQLVAGNKGMLQSRIDGLAEAGDPVALADKREVIEHTSETLAAKRMASLAKTLAEIYQDFPASQIQTMQALAKALADKPEILALARDKALRASAVQNADIEAQAQLAAMQASTPAAPTPKLSRKDKRAARAANVTGKPATPATEVILSAQESVDAILPT